MLKILTWFVMLYSSLAAQPAYTKLKAGHTIETLGIGPGFTLSAEAPLVYRDRSFLNVQAGIGVSSNLNGVSPSLSGAMSYNLLLNPYYRSPCNPYPDFNKIEAYLESGIGLSVFDPTYASVPDSFNRSAFFPMGLLGLRMHFVGSRWIYILKLRFSPVIGDAILPWGGIGFGFGWK